MNLNQVTIIGRMVRDPEAKKLPNGNAVSNVSIATSRVYKKDDQKVEETEFHNCVAFGRTAEVMNQYLTKGQLVSIVGRLKTRSWDDEASGKKMYRTEIIIDQMQMGPKAGNASSKDESKPEEEPAEDVDPDDIPF